MKKIYVEQVSGMTCPRIAGSDKYAYRITKTVNVVGIEVDGHLRLRELHIGTYLDAHDLDILAIHDVEFQVVAAKKT